MGVDTAIARCGWSADLLRSGGASVKQQYKLPFLFGGTGLQWFIDVSLPGNRGQIPCFSDHFTVIQVCYNSRVFS